MRRVLSATSLLALGALLSGFVLLDFTVQTARVRWDTMSSPTVAQRGVPFSNSFTMGSSVAGSVSYGPAKWRMAGVECTVYGVGATDGGTNSFKIDVIHEDAGVDCECDLGSAACAGAQYFSCDCSGGMTELVGLRWRMQPAATSTCQTMPGTVYCTADMFR